MASLHPRVSASEFNMLPAEIMVEIFSRLPVDDVLGCKLVSKPWRNAVRHPSFSRMHFDRLHHLDFGKLNYIFDTTWADKKYSCAEYDESSNRFSRKTKINLRPPFEDCRILCSSNGLICLYASDTHEPAYICNPITREYIMLPQSQGKDFLIGFGYSPSTNNYKVVRIYNGIVEVFTLGSGIGWRNVRKMDYDVPVWNDFRGTFVDGAIHWMDKKGTIFAIDLADEEFHELPSLLSCLPRTFLVPSLSINLHVLGNLLCALYLNKEGWEIWCLKKHKNHQHVFWSEEFSYVDDINTYPIIFTKSGGLLCYDKNDENLYRYAPEASFPRMLVNGDSVSFFGFPHKNTFVSLKALGEEDTKLMDLGESAKSSRETESIDHQPTERRTKEISKYI